MHWKDKNISLHNWHPMYFSQNKKIDDNSVGKIQGKENGIMITEIGTYRSSSENQIFKNGYLYHEGFCEYLMG